MRFLVLVLTAANLMAADWVYSWHTRTDRDGKSAGIYLSTPFPITEASTEYTIKTDENPNGVTYSLGTKYFVDGTNGDDSNDGLSLAEAKETIAAAITESGGGNSTIIVRAGTYTVTVSLAAVAGTDDTHRFMIVGYGQERPIIDGGNGTTSIFARNVASESFITLQRLKLQNTQASGVRIGNTSSERDQYFNCIDLWFTGCGNNDAFTTDGNCYYLNADNGFISHCTFERSVGHGVKMGDGASNGIIEWSISKMNGWWPGRTSFTSRTVAIDLPSDTDNQTNCIVRYNIGHGNVSHGLQLRRVRDFHVYGNEIYDYGHGLDMTGDMAGVTPHGVTILATSWGSLSNNVFRSTYSANTSGNLLHVLTTVTNGVSAVNNLLYDGAASAIYLDVSNQAQTILYNNTVIQSNATYAIGIRASQAWTPVLVNNIIWQRGSGAAGEMVFHTDEPTHTHNIYYYPDGSAPEWGSDGTGESVADPLIGTISLAKLLAGSPAIGAGTSSGAPTFDINSLTRTSIDIGAAEFVSTSSVDGDSTLTGNATFQ